MTPRLPSISREPGEIRADADVLVIGGGPAGCFAAIAAAESGASVVLVDKGYCGTSGAAAASGVGVWYVEPDAELRDQAMASRDVLGGHLADREWMQRALDETYAQVNRLAEWGYPFPVREDGSQERSSLQGPELMRMLRRKVSRSRVRIWDHSPMLELLTNPDGTIAGASGTRRQHGETWTVFAPAVVLATGGCAFKSHALGCDVLTGDGHLAAVEVGAELSGMEFSNAYALAPSFSSVTKGAIYFNGTFYHEDGRPIEGAGALRGRSVIAKTLLDEPVYCTLDRWPEAMRKHLRLAQPNFFLPFDRAGIDPFRDRFQVTLRLEGTMRGTGGLRLSDDSCSTDVPGLFAAGDAATRELICGAFTGGGSHNAAWAFSSGSWAGRGAARRARSARRIDPSAVRSKAEIGLRPTGVADPGLGPDDLVAAVQDEVFPLDKNLFRDGATLAASGARLDDLWVRSRASLASDGGAQLRAREAVAMLATARWMYASAQARAETRGMHKRVDHPQQDPYLQRRVFSGGLDEVWTAPDAEMAFGAAA